MSTVIAKRGPVNHCNAGAKASPAEDPQQTEQARCHSSLGQWQQSAKESNQGFFDVEWVHGIVYHRYLGCESKGPCHVSP